MQSKKMKPVLLQFYDYSQMFDSINLQLAISDIFDTGVDDDNMQRLTWQLKLRMGCQTER